MFGRRKLPAASRPVLEREERVLAWSWVAGGAVVAGGNRGAVVATNRGLWVPGAEQRLGWHEIHKVTWADGVLTVTGSTSSPGDDFAVTSDAPPVSMTLSNPGDLPKRVRERVTSSVAYSARHPLPGGAVRVVARRVSGRDGLSWSVRYEGGIDPEDAGIGTATGELVSAAKASISQAV